MCGEITRGVIKAAEVHVDTIQSAPLAQLSLSRERNDVLTIDGFPNGRRYSLTFPSCFLSANAEFPRKLTPFSVAEPAVSEPAVSNGGSSDQPRSLLETCPHCDSRVLFIASACPSCGKQKDNENPVA
jgi:hypothetical protein